MQRRDFFQLVSTAAGGMALASCSDDVVGPLDPTRPAIPNGMQFYPVKSSGSSLPGGGILSKLRLDATLDGTGEVYYGAIDADGVPGLYGVAVSFTGGGAVAGAERKVARVGDVIRDGRVITHLYQYDVNDTGTLAMSLADALDGELHLEENAIYLDRTKGGLERLLYDGLELSDGHVIQGRFADVDLHNDDDVLAVAHVRMPHTNNDRSSHHEIREAIIFFPAADPANAHVVATTRQIPGHHDGERGRFGLIDMHDDGAYVVQGTVGSSGDANGSPPAGSAAAPLTKATVLRGNVYGGPPRRAIDRPLLTLLGAEAAPEGNAFYGPRMGPNGHTAFVVHATETTTVLYYHGERELETGDTTPRGNTIRGIYPPVMGPESEAYVVVGTNGGDELLVINGSDRRSLLGKGDKLTGDDRAILGLIIGPSTTAVDADGRLVLVVCFEDNSAAVTIGIPR